jgi:hypothetical protein
MKAIYTNTATNETYTLAGVKSISEAWNLASFVCSRNGWNFSMFCEDVRVKLSK